MRNRRTSIALLAFGLLLPLGAAACSDDDNGGAIVADDGDAAVQTTATTAETTAADVNIQGFAFTDATVEAGATVVVANADSTTHTFTSDDDQWEAIQIAGGEDGSITAPSEPGTYTFHCDIHQTMTGTLTVE
jgi:plastocyanin